MATDTTLQKLDEWKHKYYASLSSLEQQQDYNESLQRSLGHLALISQGLDPILDTQLKALRDVLRGKEDRQKIQFILHEIKEAIVQMDANSSKDKSQSAGEIIAKLLSSLKLAKQFKTEVKTLEKRLIATTNQAVSIIIPEVQSLLERALNQTSAETPSRFGFTFFNKYKYPKDETDSQHDHKIDQQVSNDDIANPFSNKIPIHHVLMELLERLSLPTDLGKKATKIRYQIETGVDDTQLLTVINEIADIVNTLGSQVVSEKHDYEEFLKSLSSRFNELDQHIRETSTADVVAFEQRKVIGKAVEDQVIGIRNEVEDAVNLERLKSTVNDRLDFLNQHFESYHQSDYAHFTQSQQQIKELNSRLQAMEQESIVLRESAEKSRNLALKDALTGIWNRQALNEYLEKEFARWQRYERPLSLVIWDIDFFKRINDKYGHMAGDKVLKTIARIFTLETRDSDFIARFGGEEFVGIFPETCLEEALILANKIREKIADSKFHYENEPVPMTASAGLAAFKPNDTIDDVFKRADAALYRAKEAGRNRCLAD